MESTNLQYQQQQLQDQPLPSAAAAVEPSFGHVAATTTHSWTPNTISLNAGNNFNQEANPTRSRSLTHKSHIGVPPPRSMIQDLSYHHHHHHHLELDSQFSVGSFPKFSDMLNTAPSSLEGGYNRLPTTQMKTLFSGDLYSNNPQNYPNFGATNVPSLPPSRENFSQIYPTINISNMNSSASCTGLDLTMPSLDLDLLTPPPTPFSAGLSHHSQHHHLGDNNNNNNLSFSLHHMQMMNPTERSSCRSNSTNASLFTSGTGETKRPCTLMESKASPGQTALKKSRSSESRPSCPPIKVRKEKLGDRIAALQQLVAPFGKTDTASVLMEAIGYIKFLQGQVETLSVPYMKPSQNHTNRVMQGGSATDGEPKQDLRSRGLCLVPLSCMSYIAGDGGTEVWQQRPNFG